jgi:protein-L-isoaspartate O-methyltransferase
VSEYTATYSPEDNKLRMYASTRLSAEDYARVKAAGFSWAPRQELFVAPMWTPDREDILLEFCGEIGDEDKSLVERADERADRFQDYSANRADDAEQAKQHVSAITDGIPLGQPILVGHHSERHARKHAEQIESGMRRAVKMWECAQYWQDRAKGALRHAKYKELPAVRARRIKGLEADKRKIERTRAEYQQGFEFWTHSELTAHDALEGAGRLNYTGFPLPRKQGDREDFSGHAEPYSVLGNHYPNLYAPRSLEEIVAAAREYFPRQLARCDRWIAHYTNRLGYERAMLAESGGTEADKNKPQAGGACRCWASPRGGWSFIQKVNKVSVTVLDNWGNGGKNFTRTIPFDKLAQIMGKDAVDTARAEGRLVESADKVGFFITDAPSAAPATLRDDWQQRAHEEAIANKAKEEPAKDFDAMKATLKNGGVQVVSAPQLFPTPPELAARVVELANIEPGVTVLEPSAGTGNLVKAIRESVDTEVVGVEVNRELCRHLEKRFESYELQVRCADFLTCNGDLGLFERIVMNPPFENGSDIKHIEHALHMLKPGGRLVAICANGPRQRAKLQPLAEEWIDLEPGAFASSGTNVNAAIVVIQR